MFCYSIVDGLRQDLFRIKIIVSHYFGQVIYYLVLHNTNIFIILSDYLNGFHRKNKKFTFKHREKNKNHLKCHYIKYIFLLLSWFYVVVYFLKTKILLFSPG